MYIRIHGDAVMFIMSISLPVTLHFPHIYFPRPVKPYDSCLHQTRNLTPPWDRPRTDIISAVYGHSHTLTRQWRWLPVTSLVTLTNGFSNMQPGSRRGRGCCWVLNNRPHGQGDTEARRAKTFRKVDFCLSLFP